MYAMYFACNIKSNEMLIYVYFSFRIVFEAAEIIQ